MSMSMSQMYSILKTIRKTEYKDVDLNDPNDKMISDVTKCTYAILTNIDDLSPTKRAKAKGRMMKLRENLEIQNFLKKQFKKLENPFLDYTHYSHSAGGEYVYTFAEIILAIGDRAIIKSLFQHEDYDLHERDYEKLVKKLEIKKFMKSNPKSSSDTANGTFTLFPLPGKESTVGPIQPLGFNDPPEKMPPLIRANALSESDARNGCLCEM